MHDGRHGIVVERVHGQSLADLLATGADINACAERFIELHRELQATSVSSLPELVPRLDAEIGRSGLSAPSCESLQRRLAVLAESDESRLCHFDLHPGNIIVAGDRWVVIDWLTAANGPSVADSLPRSPSRPRSGS